MSDVLLDLSGTVGPAHALREARTGSAPRPARPASLSATATSPTTSYATA